MRFSAEKLLSLSLLALYGSVSLLGYGLHEIAGVHHHDHGHGHGNRTVAAHAGHHHHHHHGPCSHDHGPSSGSLTVTHDCEICEFLDQARSEVPQVAAANFTDRLVADAVVAAPCVFPQTEVCLYAPRGPPALVG